MRTVIFTHSLVSDWNHGNAHFLRGVASELINRGHELTMLEPADGWSRTNLRRDAGEAAERGFAESFPELSSQTYTLGDLDMEHCLDGADLVLVHEWNDPELVRRVGEHRSRHPEYRLLFHDTHHRAVTAPEQMARYDLREYDGVLAFGEAIRRIYLERDWAQAVYTWHEAADTRRFRPLPASGETREDLVWIGNWGDGERTRELHEFLLGPARELGLSGSVHGVRYPKEAVEAVQDSGLRYRGWIANHLVPQTFADHRVTVHVPRGPYVRALPGIPTIRVFEALACGIPLISAPWEDAEGLFRPGQDFLLVQDGPSMAQALRSVLQDRELAESLSRSGLEQILARHTCAHRVDELEAIVGELRGQREPAAA